MEDLGAFQASKRDDSIEEMVKIARDLAGMAWCLTRMTFTSQVKLAGAAEVLRARITLAGKSTIDGETAVERETMTMEIMKEEKTWVIGVGRDRTLHIGQRSSYFRYPKSYARKQSRWSCLRKQGWPIMHWFDGGNRFSPFTVDVERKHYLHG